MSARNLRLIFLFLWILTFSGCSNDNSKDLDKWLGNYEYAEPSIKAIAGYNMVMLWDLSITKVNGICKAIVNVNGQQTSFSLLANIRGDNHTISIIYDQLLQGSDEKIRKGDILFTLSGTSEKLMTKWATLEPRLSEKFPKECSCFSFAGTNANNNILTVP